MAHALRPIAEFRDTAIPSAGFIYVEWEQCRSVANSMESEEINSDKAAIGVGKLDFRGRRTGREGTEAFRAIRAGAQFVQQRLSGTCRQGQHGVMSSAHTVLMLPFARR